MKRYFIISLSHSTPDQLIFWRADDNGYTSIPFLAGLYTEKEITDRIEYYTENSVPVPVEAWEGVGLTIKFNAKALRDFRKTWKEQITKRVTS